MSDWEGYADRLARKFDYRNTFFHVEPRFDITQISDYGESQYDFLISSDVFEHILSPVSLAFKNAFKILKPGGVLVLTVPFVPDGITHEHFEGLHEYEIIDVENKKRLKSVSKEGTVQWFDNLIFHGGAGATLEMRVFAFPSLLAEFRNAGFEDIKTFEHEVPRFGIPDAGGYSFPISARRPVSP